MTRLVLFELFVTNLILFGHQQQQKLFVSWQFSGPYGVTKYGGGWRKDIVNQCLEFAFCADTFAIVEKLPCGIVYLSIRVHVKAPTHWQRSHTQILHTLVRMGSAALVAAVALPRHGDLNFQKDINEASVPFKVHSSLYFLLGDDWEK